MAIDHAHIIYLEMKFMELMSCDYHGVIKVVELA